MMKANSNSARIIAFYLPQFHPIPENDLWWGKGFTEWTNVAKARPLFKGHYQPHIPADLGFYDLRVPETRLAQAEMARSYGIEGFCYYHYWFAGKRLLERPFSEVLKSGQPDFPFCLCWANETWSGVWHGAPDRVLIEQTYPGPEDERHHFAVLLDAFSDSRYIKVDGKPLLVIYNPALPETERVIDHWRNLAIEAGLPGLHLVGYDYKPTALLKRNYDAAISKNLHDISWPPAPKFIREIWVRYKMLANRTLTVLPYEKLLGKLLSPEALQNDIYPCVIPNWDNTPRSGAKGKVLHGSSPELFSTHFRSAIKMVASKPYQHRLIFVKSWNEWAEGNHLEPDLRFGKAYLDALRAELESIMVREKPRG